MTVKLDVGEVVLGLEMKVAVVDVDVDDAGVDEGLLELEVEVILKQAWDRESMFGTMMDSEHEFRMHVWAFGW